MIRIDVRKAKCVGHARCAAVSPDVYELDDAGYIAFERKIVGPEQAANANRGARACPERVITVQENNAGAPSRPTEE